MIVWSCRRRRYRTYAQFRALLGCRTVLGVAEAAGIPAPEKRTAMYLEPRELALGTAVNQIGISVGMSRRR